MVFFRGMMNQQRSLPRRNQMPMRTGGNFGGAFALNPSLSGLSTITQPRFKGQGVTETNPDIIAALETPGGGTFEGANGRITTVEPDYIAPPSPANNMSFAQGMISNIIPEQDGVATGSQQISDPNIDGQRVLSNDEQATIDNAALQERLKGRYDAPGYTTTDKIAAIAGVLGDVFSAPGDRNKTASIMQTIEARRAGDMQRQQQKASAEIMEKGLSNLSPELQALARANPEAFYSAYLPSIIQDQSKLGTARIGEIDANTRSRLADIGMDEKTFDEQVRQFEATFEQRDNETKLDYDFRVKQQELDEVQRRITNQRLQDTLDFNMSDADRKNVLDQQRLDIQELNALNKEGKTKDPTAKQSDNAMFYTKALTAFKAIDGSDYNPAKLFSQIAPLQVLKGEKRDTYETAGDAFIQAILRPESGAVIGPKEMIEYRQTYLPQRGDSKKALEFKRQLRLSSMNSLALGTGGLVEPYNPDAVTTSVTPSVTNIGGVNYSTQDQ